MAIFGLGDDGATAVKEKKSAPKSASSKKAKKSTSKKASTSSSQGDEAKALLEKMEAKKDADECPFC